METVEVNPGAPAGWAPLRATETDLLLERVGIKPEEQEKLVDEALSVLSQCPDPNSPARGSTGLVVGYVQSGKTLSFTTVAALARDNRYPLVIVIAGTSIHLFGQSERRLKADLGLDTRHDYQWRHISNPTLKMLPEIQAALSEWSDPRARPEERQTLLITVMKHHGRLRQLNSLLRQLDLEHTPVLVIDDEADHAGLNTRVNQEDMSTTYERLITLREQLPHHGYLMYTATPQAPLLISAIDALSPDFAVVLTPGSAYTGGFEFFMENEGRLVRTIPGEEIDREDDEEPTGPTPTLRFALATFFLGVAAGMLTGFKDAKNRSMLVHPSQLTDEHGRHMVWVNTIKDQWLRVFRAADDEPAKLAAKAEFKAAYDDLHATVPDLPPWEVLWGNLDRAIIKTNVREVNATVGKAPEIEWRQNYSWILVGGQAMDRGFTVEGLTVTYMPRGIGVGNADAIQQRARFFGYKEAYLGYCRVFVAEATRHAYAVYVEHEEDLRARLKGHRGSLKEWRRAFFLSTTLAPTRQQVLSLDYFQSGLGNQWFWSRAPHEATDAVDQNRRLVARFTATHPFTADPTRYPLPSQQHRVCSMPLAKVYEDLLVDFRLANQRDSIQLTGLLLQLKRYLEVAPAATCTVYHISRADRGERSARDGEVGRLFQGAYPSTGPLQGTQYPGDEELHGDEVTVQLHTYDVAGEAGTVQDVPFLAVWVPSDARGEWLVRADDA